MAVLETKYITVGTYFNATGYAPPYAGSVSDTSGGSSNTSLTDLYTNSTLAGLYYNTSASAVALQINDVSANVVNNVWDYMKVGSTSYPRFSGSFSQTSGVKTWSWTGGSNPFGSNSTVSTITFETGALTYSLSANIRSTSVTATQNCVAGDNLVTTVLTAYTPNVSTLTNCTASIAVSNGSSASSSTVFTVVPTSAGAYSARLYQPYQAEEYVLSGTANAAASGGSGGSSGFGFQQFDSAGNLILDSSAPVKTFVVYEQAKSIYVNAPYSGSTNYTDVTVPGVTSQQDLDDNYVFIRRDGGAFSIWGADTTHGYAYQSTNTVRFTWRGTCETFNIGGGSSSRACNQFDAHTQLFDIIILGKDLS
tara:strand:+ start:584 stop:1678 length:1095 start_codon:yes stop_codon:yes gene_type:complete